MSVYSRLTFGSFSIHYQSLNDNFLTSDPSTVHSRFTFFAQVKDGVIVFKKKESFLVELISNHSWQNYLCFRDSLSNNSLLILE